MQVEFYMELNFMVIQDQIINDKLLTLQMINNVIDNTPLDFLLQLQYKKCSVQLTCPRDDWDYDITTSVFVQASKSCH